MRRRSRRSARPGARFLPIADVSGARCGIATLAYPGCKGEARPHGDRRDDGWVERLAMGINELVLVGTGFVVARIVYLFYFTQRKAAEADSR